CRHPTQHNPLFSRCFTCASFRLPVTSLTSLSLSPLSPKQSRRRQGGSYYSTAREFWYPLSVAGRG
ncbi:unnamed protein product, partial [Musa textilis]